MDWPCDWCNGTGEVPCDCEGYDDDCPACGGSGHHRCPQCDGTGVVQYDD